MEKGFDEVLAGNFRTGLRYILFVFLLVSFVFLLWYFFWQEEALCKDAWHKHTDAESGTEKMEYLENCRQELAVLERNKQDSSFLYYQISGGRKAGMGFLCRKSDTLLRFWASGGQIVSMQIGHKFDLYLWQSTASAFYYRLGLKGKLQALGSYETYGDLRSFYVLDQTLLLLFQKKLVFLSSPQGAVFQDITPADAAELSSLLLDRNHLGQESSFLLTYTLKSIGAQKTENISLESLIGKKHSLGIYFVP